MKWIVPDLVHISDLQLSEIRENNILLLIDNREPLKNLAGFYAIIKGNEKSVSCIILRIGLVKYKPLLSMAKFNTPINSMEQIQYMINERMNLPCESILRTVTFSVEFYLKKIIEYSLSGMNVKMMASKLCVSEKTLYKLRGDVCKIMGYRNYIHACIHIFENNLHVEDFEVPCSWISN